MNRCKVCGDKYNIVVCNENVYCMDCITKAFKVYTQSKKKVS